MKKVSLWAIIAISFSLSSLISCTNDLTATDEALTETATDESQVAAASDQIVSTADDYVNALDALGFQAVKGSSETSSVNPSIKITMDSIVITIDRPGLNDYPKNICLDFGKGVTVKRGNVLKGKIYITITGKMNVANSSRTFTFVDFYVNNNQVKGGKTVTFKGYTDLQEPYWTIVAADTLIRTDGTKIIWNTERTRTRVGTNDTPLIYWDDLYSIKGTSNGVNAKGVAYSMVIQENNPLIVSGNYPFFTKGSVVISTEKKTVLVDYGDGTKDNKATATVNGITKEFTLKK